jgi:YARHG domain
MLKKLLLPLILSVLAASTFAQVDLKKWQTFNFATRAVKNTDLASYELEDLQMLRGIVFGKHGRIFKEVSIQDYLSKQPWYKPNAKFTNAMLKPIERKNIDLVRQMEAEKHSSVEPGDLRFWEKKEITENDLREYTGAEWRIMIAEIEAIHGKSFPEEEWLQKYFEDRYWYHSNAAYDASTLTEIERKNLTALNEARGKNRHADVSVGDMDKFENVLLKEDQLKGLNFEELRLIRSEFFARHGKKFTVAAYKAFFSWQDWYKPVKDQSKVKLNAVEEQNVKLILDYEARMHEQLSTVPMVEASVHDLYAEDLRVLRNEIYARHGRIFSAPKSKDLQKYFEAQPWYKANPDFKDDQLTEVEFRNISIIKAAEETAISKFSEVEG